VSLESIPLAQVEKMAWRDGFRLEFGSGADLTIWVPKDQKQYAVKHSRFKGVSALVIDNDYYRVAMKIEPA